MFIMTSPIHTCYINNGQWEMENEGEKCYFKLVREASVLRWYLNRELKLVRK